MPHLEIDYKYWFWSDYTRMKTENSYCDFRYEFDKMLSEGLAFYDNKIAKYYK